MSYAISAIRLGSFHPKTNNLVETNWEKSEFFTCCFSRHKKRFGKFSTLSLKPEAKYNGANFPLGLIYGPFFTKTLITHHPFEC
jgi:hypothetical protein